MGLPLACPRDPVVIRHGILPRQPMTITPAGSRGKPLGFYRVPTGFRGLPPAAFRHGNLLPTATHEKREGGRASQSATE